MVKHVKEMSTLPSMGKTAKEKVLSDASPVLWDGQHLPRVTPVSKQPQLQAPKSAKKSTVWWDLRVQVPSKELQEQKTEQKQCTQKNR